MARGREMGEEVKEVTERIGPQISPDKMLRKWTCDCKIGGRSGVG